MGKMAKAKSLAGQGAKWVLTIYSTLVLLYLGYSAFELISDEVTTAIALTLALPQLVIIFSFLPDRLRLRKKKVDVHTGLLIVEKDDEAPQPTDLPEETTKS